MKVSKVQKSNGDVIIDISQDTVNANNLLAGATAHGSDGELVTGAVITHNVIDNLTSDSTTDALSAKQGKVLKGLVDDNAEIAEVTDTTPYLYKASEHDAVYDEIVGGSVAWNQLVANSGSSLSVTITSGHKYVMKKSGTLSVGASSGSAITGLTGGTDWITDLTLMFGSTTIADYVYSLEQSTAGSGVEWLKSYGFFTKDYYAYNAGTLTSVNTSGKKVVGKNLCDTVKVGVYYTANGNYNPAFTEYSCTELIKILPNTQYTASVIWEGEMGTDNVAIFYDANGNYLGKNTGGYIHTNTYPFTFTTPQNAVYCGLDINIKRSSITGVQIELGSNSTDYEPYTSITYPIQSTDLRGLYKLNGNKLYTDGDIYSADGTVTRKYEYRDYQSGDESLANAITDGTHTIYKLSAPTTETASPFASPQMVYRRGTEEYLDTRDVPIPVGGNRKYIDIPEWMVNEYFDDVRSSASGAIKDDLVFDESSSSHGHGLVSSDNKKEIVFNHHMVTLTSSSGNRASLSDGDELGQIVLRQGDVEISGYKHSSQGNSQSASIHVYYDAIEVNTGNDGIIITNVMQSGTGVNLVIAPDGTICKASSSRNVKHDIEYVKDANDYHDALMQLKPATFIYNSDKTETQKLGMIAEDVADVCPIAGMVDKNGKVENYDDRAVIAMLVAEVQRLNAEIEKLKGR